MLAEEAGNGPHSLPNRWAGSAWESSETTDGVTQGKLSHYSFGGSIPLHFLSPQDVMIVLREAVRLVADELKQAQGRRMPAQPQRLRVAGPVNLFLPFG